jgi:predicted nucleotidyltransferase
MIQEKIIRKVTSVGNGAHIFAPREWLNENVLIVRLDKKEIKEQILEKLLPFLDKVIGVFLFGSHARKEANEFSDIDVLVIAKEKFKIKEEGFDFVVITEKDILPAIKLNPILMYSIFREAVPIINGEKLEMLKNLKLNNKIFIPFVKQTEKVLKNNREMLELDKKTGKYASDSVIYSLFLRLKGIFIIKCLLRKKNYLNRELKEWLGLEEKTYLSGYGTYSDVRKGIYGKDSFVKVEDGEKLLCFLEKELNLLKKKING